ncbi:DUF6461 domain-containing protein [Streptomyces regalis]|uniref:Uncharacterized protein n=1 Tax=Streptomyces regalis TaxID=68262 RepID=A0A101J5T9_9ACTN|nr:DUF6461 domain-containing protein [Streptomyces regalis]KUL20760.1 hypothetical protein ADL12_47980 [Streptomyces regalis]
MTGKTTAADYAWLEERYENLMQAYCITLVRGLTPEELLRELKAEPGPRITGMDGLCEPSYDVSGSHRLFVGATAVGDWSLMVEFNGYLGVTNEAMLPLSRGRTVVSHFLNVNAVDHFCWYDNGELRVHFEPLFAYYRDGSHPDELLEDMRESGFDLVEHEEHDDREYEGLTGASFALAHRITGIRLTPELLESAEFTCGTAPVPGG